MSELQNPHDKLFKETFLDREVVTDFLKHYLPEEILAIIDVETIEALKESFIEKDLREFYSDLLFRVSFGSQEGYVYFLFEHKSSPEKTIVFQLLRYMLAIWQREIEEGKEELPVILPIVLYHGERKWEHPKMVRDWFKNLDQSLAKFIPNFELLFYNFSEFSDTEIKGILKLQAYLRLIRHLYSDDLELLYSIVIQLDQAGESNYFETVIIYL